MSDLREAAEMALKALENPWEVKPKGVADAIQALRQALAQPVDAVNMSQERVDETGKCEHEYVNDRERLEAIVNVICRYLPPGGTDIKSAMSEIIALVDPLPPKREWVGLMDDETDGLIHSATYMDETDLWHLVSLVEERLKEKNT